MKCTKKVTVPSAPPGFQICHWKCALGVFNSVISNTYNSALTTEWNGVFDQQSTSLAGPLWYFVHQMVKDQNGVPKKFSASEAFHYPAGDWQDNDKFTQLYWDGVNWNLLISTVGTFIGVIQPNFELWAGTGDSIDPTNPAGVYTKNQAGDPQKMLVARASDTCGGIDFTSTAWNPPYQFNLVAGTLSGSGATLSFDMTSAFQNPPASIGIQGNVNYSGRGPICCNLHLVITALSQPGNTNVTISGMSDTISVLIPGPGVYDFSGVFLFDAGNLTLQMSGSFTGHLAGFATWSTVN